MRFRDDLMNYPFRPKGRGTPLRGRSDRQGWWAFVQHRRRCAAISLAVWVWGVKVRHYQPVVISL